MRARVLWVGLGLLLLAGLLAFVVWVPGGPIDGEARLAAWFREGHAPALVVEEALASPSGQTVVRAAHAPEEGAGWDELVFVQLRSLGGIRRFFPEPEGDARGDGPAGGEDARKAERWRADPSFAFHSEVHAGRLAWDRWEAEVRVERAWLEGGGWQESARVDLGQEDRPLVLFVRWPREVGWSEAELEALLRRIAMLPPSS